MFTPAPASTETTIIGLNIANILTVVSITVNVQLINNDGDNVHIVKSAIVPVGSSLVAVGGDQKIVMNASDIFEDNSKSSISGGRYTVCIGDYLMALSTIGANQMSFNLLIP